MDLRGTITHSVILAICGIGLLGNVFSLAVMVRQILLNGTKVRYYYLLIGLTVSDILLLLLSMFRSLIDLRLITGVNPWDGTSPMREIDFFWDWMCTGGTKYYTVGISVERCLVISYPLWANVHITSSRTKKSSLGIFIFLAILTTFSYFYSYHWDSNKSFQIFPAVVLHFLPFVVVLAVNLVTYFKLRKYQQKREALNSCETDLTEEVRVTRMLLMVVLVFGICYSFETVRRVMAYANYFDPLIANYDYVINQLSSIFYVTNSAINFIIYSVMGKTFRRHCWELLELFKRLLCCFKRGRKSVTSSSSNDSGVTGVVSITNH